MAETYNNLGLVDDWNVLQQQQQQQQQQQHPTYHPIKEPLVNPRTYKVLKPRHSSGHEGHFRDMSRYNPGRCEINSKAQFETNPNRIEFREAWLTFAARIIRSESQSKRCLARLPRGRVGMSRFVSVPKRPSTKTPVTRFNITRVAKAM